MRIGERNRTCSRSVAQLGVLSAAMLTLLMFASGCRKNEPRARRTAPPATAQADATAKLNFVPAPVGKPIEGKPWITHLAIADLDADGLPDILVCDAQSNTIGWIRQSPRGTFTEVNVGTEVKAPVHVSPCDIDADGDLDLLVASMGLVFPNNDRIGSVVVIENLGGRQWQNRVLAENIMRVTDVRGADIDGDGRLDLVVGQFGYDQGEIRWMRNEGDWQFSTRTLLGLSGTIHTPVADFDGDGRPDFAALVSQEWEEIHLFRNEGGGELRGSVIWGSTNEDYGSSGLDAADVDGDGDPDIIFSNGDAFDYARPGPRPWHGVQWLENDRGSFKFHRVGDMPGSYSPVCVDLDGDGRRDFAAVSGFNKWGDPFAVSLVAWTNDGQNNFTPMVLAHTPTHLVALVAADLDGDGQVELVTGGFHAFPPWEKMSRVTLWKRQ